MLLHLTQGLFFEKLPDSAVRILKTENAREDGPVLLDITLDAAQWSSVLASMSHYGEENYGFYRALSFHKGDVIDATAIPVESDLRRHWIFKALAGDAD